MTCDPNGKRVNELVQDDQIFEKVTYFMYHHFETVRGNFMDLMLNEREDSKA